MPLNKVTGSLLSYIWCCWLSLECAGESAPENIHFNIFEGSNLQSKQQILLELVNRNHLHPDNILNCCTWEPSSQPAHLTVVLPKLQTRSEYKQPWFLQFEETKRKNKGLRSTSQQTSQHWEQPDQQNCLVAKTDRTIYCGKAWTP